MGLDTTHDCFHGAYSRFRRFREAVQEAAGIDEEKWDEEIHSIIENGDVCPDLLGAYYGWAPDDDIKYLLAHSDCDGLLWPMHALKIAVRLEELGPVLGRSDKTSALQAEQFAAGCYKAAALGEPVRFG